MNKGIVTLIIVVMSAVGSTLALAGTPKPNPANATGLVQLTECPPPNEQGAYFVRGHDKQTGEVICGFAWYNACPYVESVPADDPMCEKARQSQEPAPVLESPAITVISEPAQPAECGGK